MNIVHLSDVYLPRIGGIELHIRDLAHHQREQGHRVTVVTTTDGAPRGPVAVRRYPFAWQVPAGLLEEADVVHGHSSIVSPFAWALAHRAAVAGTPTLVTMHSLLRNPAAWAPAVRPAAHVLHPGIAWTAVSTVAAAQLHRAIGRPVDVLPNGIDVAAWAARQTPARRSVTIAAVGRLAPRKRALPLVRILADVRRRVDPAVRLRAVLIGDGPQRNAVARSVHRHGLRHWVELTGQLPREQIVDRLSAADLFLAPARLESFGIAALEARSVGLPVVAMRAAGVSDFIADGVEGVLVDSDHEMAAAAAALVTDRARLQRIRAHNMRTGPSLDWDVVCRLTMDAYRRVQGVPADEGASLLAVSQAPYAR